MILKPTRWLINHDEIRAMRHDPLAKCDTPAVILTENLAKCVEIIKAVTPNPGIIVFNDMYDPEHNAVEGDAPEKTTTACRSSQWSTANSTVLGTELTEV